MAKQPYKWVICYIDISKLHLLGMDLRKHDRYRSVQAYMPCIKILKKKLKGKEHFESVPLLFNYGFFKVPKYFIPNYHFLDQMVRDIRCLYAWVKDPARSKKDPLLSYGKLTLYNPSGVALATDREVLKIKKAEKNRSIYSSKDLDTLYEGKIIILKKYPFEDLPAEIVSIDRKKKKAYVRLLLETNITERAIEVSFENIFYTAYQDNYLNLEMKEQSIEEIRTKNKNFDGYEVEDK